MKRVLIQGAMPVELEYFLEQPCFQDVKQEMVSGYTFYRGTAYNLELILSLTEMGMMNGAISTMIAIQEYQPDLVINQGTAGGHKKDLHTGDIILGAEAVNVNSLEMPTRDFGEGIASENWIPMNVEKYKATPELLNYFQEKMKSKKYPGIIREGILGSGDLFSKEKDRIQWICETFHNESEDMESCAVYQVCEKMKIPHIAIRILSNNELWDEPFEPAQAKVLQKVIWESLEGLDEKISVL